MHIPPTTCGFALIAWMVLFSTTSAQGPAGSGNPSDEVTWHTNYARAIKAAEREGKMLLLLCRDPNAGESGRRFRSTVLAEPEIRAKLRAYVCVEVPTDLQITVNGQQRKLLDFPTFEGLQGRAGIVILDYAHQQTPYYGCAVSTFPFTENATCTARETLVLLDLPPGMPEQRMSAYLARVGSGGSTINEETPPAQKQTSAAVGIRWHDDYGEAVEEAGRQGKMLLLRFFDRKENELCRRLDTETLADGEVRGKLQGFVCARLPLDVKIPIDGKEKVLLEQNVFREMLGKPGVAILDFADRSSTTYGRVVSTFPITRKLWYTPRRMLVILGLPRGTLTQRTLIYAVRIHPEHPASTGGQVDGYLVEEAESHSGHQARIRRQGHHHWETRFHRITARLKGGLIAKEVCAESWPGEPLVEAAVECVRCWRYSAGHWSAVRAYHELYGYDMKRGSNGIWYATGIFGSG